MFGAVLITFTITSLSMLVLFLYFNMKKQDAENNRLQKTNEHLNNQISTMICQDHDHQKRSAYDQGLYDGRETDTLYRKILSQYSVGEQAAVMMYGENESSGTRRRK